MHVSFVRLTAYINEPQLYKPDFDAMTDVKNYIGLFRARKRIHIHDVDIKSAS